MTQFDIITIFPEMFDAYFNESIIKRAIKSKKITINLHNLRDFTTDKHKTVDDRPYGGGPGMIMLVEPWYKAIAKIRSKSKKKKTRVIMLSPDGKTFNHDEAKRLADYDQIVLLAGRYEGFDTRIENYIDEKISIGDYVLAGGELPAMVVTESIARYVPGVLGHEDATKEETTKDLAEYPQYSRPETFKGKKVPKVLLSGHHADIEAWRKDQRKKR